MSSRLEAAVAELGAAIAELVEAATRTIDGPPELLSIAAAARHLGIGRTALYHELATGHLRSFKIGRRRLIPASTIDAYIAARAEENPGAPLIAVGPSQLPIAGRRTRTDAREWLR